MRYVWKTESDFTLEDADELGYMLREISEKQRLGHLNIFNTDQRSRIFEKGGEIAFIYDSNERLSGCGYLDRNLEQIEDLLEPAQGISASSDMYFNMSQFGVLGGFFLREGLKEERREIPSLLNKAMEAQKNKLVDPISRFLFLIAEGNAFMKLLTRQLKRKTPVEVLEIETMVSVSNMLGDTENKTIYDTLYLLDYSGKVEQTIR